MKQFFNAAPSVKCEIICEMTSRDNNLLNITWLCEIAGISRSGYYYWQKQQKARAAKETSDEEDFALILEAFKYRGYDKGVRGIHMRLLHLEPPIVMNPKKIRRLMQKFGLQCPIRKANPYRRMAKALQTSKVAPNILNRQFRVSGARRVLLTDITYISRRKDREDGPDKFSYLSVIMDAFTKEVLAWVCSSSIDVDIVLETVNQLIANHGGELETDVLLHSDQGCHYTSHKFVDLLKDVQLRQSMSRRGNCWDNAPQESFFGHMKAEIQLNASDNHAHITQKISEWMAYYNTARPQWNLRKLTPAEYYQFTKTSVYPLAIPTPTEKVSPKKYKKKTSEQSTETNANTAQAIGGAAPEPPYPPQKVCGLFGDPGEFIAPSLQSDENETGDDCSPPVTP